MASVLSSWLTAAGRYGNPTASHKGDRDEYADFAKHFLNNFAPEIFKAYLQQVDKWVAKNIWISKPCLSMILAFLDECVKPKTMWAHLKPNMENLIAHLVFPVLCQSDEDLELFDTDPAEYLHRKLNSYEEVSAPDVAATNFLVTLTKSRKKQTFVVLNFINNVVNRYETAPEDQKNPREKEGALRMIGTLASVVLEKQSPVANQAEFFFVQHVFPEFRSPHGFLRARACDTLGKFEQLNFTDANHLTIIYRNILESMADPELPVRVEAALALQPLIRHEVIRSAMQQSIPQIMQQLLKLANDVDVDALANVMEDFVEVFAAELTPFAVALAEQLRDTYMRLVRELIERNSQKTYDDTYGDFLDDKAITALGVLQTIGTLILTLESTPEVLAQLETILIPVITITLENKLYGEYALRREAGRDGCLKQSLTTIQTSSTKSLRSSIAVLSRQSRSLRQCGRRLNSCRRALRMAPSFTWKVGIRGLWRSKLRSSIPVRLTLSRNASEMLPALDNFVAYGSERLLQNPAYLQAMVGMVQETFLSDRFGGVDRICGCKLAESMMLNLRGHVDQHIPTFVELGMTKLVTDEPKVKSYRVHLMEMVINATYYNPSLALHVLESKDWTNKFFSLWFSNIESMTRVHDKKLSIAAIVALMGLRADQVPASVQQGWPRLLQGIVRLFQTLPAAIKSESATISFEPLKPHHGRDAADGRLEDREEATREDFTAADDGEDEVDADDRGWGEDGNWVGEYDDVEEDVSDESAQYIDFLHEEAQKIRDDTDTADDEDLEEESLLETPLERVEPYTLFRDALLRKLHHLVVISSPLPVFLRLSFSLSRHPATASTPRS